MHFMAQSPSRDPVQTLYPNSISNVSSSFATPIRPRFKRVNSERASRLLEAGYRPRSESTIRPSTSRKRSRIDIKEDSFKPQLEQNCLHARGQLVNNTETTFNEYDASNTASCGWKADGQLQQQQTYQLTLADTRDSFHSSTGVCRAQNFRIATNTFSGNPNEAPRKTARISSISLQHSSKSPFDEFSQRLGVGWSSVSDSDQDVQAAVRGWSNFIENHFPITNVKIRLRSRGLSCFLVEASEGYFLFGDDLKQGKLVSVNLENVWTNLQGPVPVFEGDTLSIMTDNKKAYQ